LWDNPIPVRNFTIDEVRAVLHRKNYVFFDNNKRFNLNIIGIRAKEHSTNTFNDRLYVIYRDEMLDWQCKRFECTTDPGLYYLKNPMNVEGTAVMLPGQYLRAYALGRHRGLYPALVQIGAIDYVRDGNLNAVIDALTGGRKRNGVIGANIHRAKADGKSKQVDKWSAGCQVLADSSDFETLIDLAVKALLPQYRQSDKFSYTLLDEKDFL
jgi:hypothetical protein